jgi:hypothetical protein
MSVSSSFRVGRSRGRLMCSIFGHHSSCVASLHCRVSPADHCRSLYEKKRQLSISRTFRVGRRGRLMGFTVGHLSARHATRACGHSRACERPQLSRNGVVHDRTAVDENCCASTCRRDFSRLCGGCVAGSPQRYDSGWLVRLTWVIGSFGRRNNFCDAVGVFGARRVVRRQQQMHSLARACIASDNTTGGNPHAGERPVFSRFFVM